MSVGSPSSVERRYAPRHRLDTGRMTSAPLTRPSASTARPVAGPRHPVSGTT